MAHPSHFLAMYLFNRYYDACQSRCTGKSLRMDLQDFEAPRPLCKQKAKSGGGLCRCGEQQWGDDARATDVWQGGWYGGTGLRPPVPVLAAQLPPVALPPSPEQRLPCQHPRWVLASSAAKFTPPPPPPACSPHRTLSGCFYHMPHL